MQTKTKAITKQVKKSINKKSRVNRSPITEPLNFEIVGTVQEAFIDDRIDGKYTIQKRFDINTELRN